VFTSVPFHLGADALLDGGKDTDTLSGINSVTLSGTSHIHEKGFEQHF
jgi:hypothetical protein